ncbi:MAG: hypothetical protein M3N18_11655 [Actinomycetota bacterium]|nr:hypothetical protein [Actinomycetota bacterium]
MVGRGTLAVLGVPLAFALALGTLVSCGGAQEKGGQVAEPVTEELPEETTVQRTAVVRVSGPPGTAYSGTYATGGETQTVDNATLEAEPTEYPVEIGDDDTGLTAAFRKTRPGRETLGAEILVDGEVVTQSETSAELGSVTISWAPPEAMPGQRTTLPGEFKADRTTLPGEPGSAPSR